MSGSRGGLRCGTGTSSADDSSGWALKRVLALSLTEDVPFGSDVSTGGGLGTGFHDGGVGDGFGSLSSLEDSSGWALKRVLALSLTEDVPFGSDVSTGGGLGTGFNDGGIGGGFGSVSSLDSSSGWALKRVLALSLTEDVPFGSDVSTGGGLGTGFNDGGVGDGFGSVSSLEDSSGWGLKRVLALSLTEDVPFGSDVSTGGGLGTGFNDGGIGGGFGSVSSPDDSSGRALKRVLALSLPEDVPFGSDLSTGGGLGTGFNDGGIGDGFGSLSSFEDSSGWALKRVLALSLTEDVPFCSDVSTGGGLGTGFNDGGVGDGFGSVSSLEDSSGWALKRVLALSLTEDVPFGSNVSTGDGLGTGFNDGGVGDGFGSVSSFEDSSGWALK